MNSIPKPIQDLIQAFSRLPGIGPKTAQRLAMHLLTASDAVARDLSNALKDLKTSTTFCSTCFHLTTENPCSICSDSYRDTSLLCVVEEPVDLISIEKAGSYKGLYHVLHGHLSPIDGIGPQNLKIHELLSRLQPSNGSQKATMIREVILATNPTMEGESTAHYLLSQIKPLGIKVTRIARGLPSGANIEYADDVTLTQAMEGRKEF
ncbi:MAG: recombination mediator RecR [Candidatus Gracilibacteria bacterium]